MRPPIIIDDPTFNDRVTRLTLTGADLDRAGITLEEVADLVYTRRMRINPQAGEPAKVVVKTKKEKITGDKLDDLLG